MAQPHYQPHSRAALRRLSEGESVRTLVIALAANLLIAIAKLVAGIISRSTAMLAEAAHSLADSLNEVFLGISLRRAKKPAHDAHPFGHGRERFLWAFMAAIASFLIGGCASVAMAIHALTHEGKSGSRTAAWIVLAITFIAEGASWLQSVRQARSQAREYGMPLTSYLRYSSDPLVRAIVVEDSAAMIGVVLAAGGLLASQMSKSSVPDSIASLLIGLLLAVTAFGLARPLADFLVGRSVRGERMRELRAVLEQSAAIQEIRSLHAVYTGPEEVYVMAKIIPSLSLTTEELARAMDEIDRAIRASSPLVADVYLDVTTRDGR